MPFDPDCDFCRISQIDDSSVEVVCESDGWMAFFPTEPATPGHTLIIPRAHVPDLWDIDPLMGSELMGAVTRVGKAIRVALSPEGMNLISSSGEVAEQTIFHLHLHVVPRWSSDGFGDIWPPEKHMDSARKEGLADRVRAACERVSP